MDTIYLSDIPFNQLKKIEGDYLEGTIFHDEVTAYKLYKQPLWNFSLWNKKEKMKFFNENHTHLPILTFHHFIKVSEEHPSFVGFSTDYFKSLELLEWITKHSTKENLEILSSISHGLQQIHKDDRNIIIGDLNFSNILVNENKEYRFCDFDSYHIGKKRADAHSQLLDDYLRIRKISYHDHVNFDKISFLLMTYIAIFKKQFADISFYEYDALKEQIPFLEESKEYYKVLKYANHKAPCVPYLHEITKI